MHRNVAFGHGGRLRVKTGCITCRIRRVKCDEAKPDCQRCLTTARTCDGYGDSVTAKVNSPRLRSPNTPSNPSGINKRFLLPNFDDDKQRSSFSFFVNCTVANFGTDYGGEFWSRRILQLSLSEPAVRYAVCSLATLHRKFRERQSLGPSVAVGELKSYSLEQYNSAVHHTYRLLEACTTGDHKTIVKCSVVCVLFVCCENLMGNFKNAQMHLNNGLKIMSSLADSTASSIPDDIRSVFHRLDLQAMLFAFADSMAHYYQEGIAKPRPTPDIFFSVTEAMECLVHNFRWILYLGSEIRRTHQPVAAQDLSTGSSILREWNMKFDGLLNALEPQIRQKSQYTTILLRMYHAVMTIILSVGMPGPECLHDAHILTFQEIVTWGETLISGKIIRPQGGSHVFTFEPGLIFPLVFAGLKCRDRVLRRRAVDVLRTSDNQEGAWESIAAARVVEFVISVEEDGCPEFIPEDSRARVVSVDADIEKRTAQISYFLPSPILSIRRRTISLAFDEQNEL